jgi:hypothetical protein
LSPNFACGGKVRHDHLFALFALFPRYARKKRKPKEIGHRSAAGQKRQLRKSCLLTPDFWAS